MMRVTLLTPALLLLVACELEPMNDVGSVGDTGGADTGGVDTGGTNGGGTTTGGASGGGTGGAAPVECSAYEDSTGWSVTILIRNESSRTLHLGSTEVTCGDGPLVEILDGAGEPFRAAFSEACMSCASAMAGPVFGCPPICFFPRSITLAPYEATEVIWGGLFYADPVELPDRCVADGVSTPVTCTRLEQIEPGLTFTFRASAGTSLECPEEVAIGCGACEPNAEGGCTTVGPVITGTMLSAETTVTLGPSYGVGPMSGGGAIQPIELFFTD